MTLNDQIRNRLHRALDRFVVSSPRFRALARVCDEAAFKETEHPRARSGENAGQFVKKGTATTGSASVKGPRPENELTRSATQTRTGSGAKGAQAYPLAPALKPASYNVKNFRLPKADQKVPSNWEKVLVNPDPNGDVTLAGINGAGKPAVQYSKAYREKVLAHRQKTWPKWARETDVMKRIPLDAQDVRLAPNRDADVWARYTNTVGEPISVDSVRFAEKKTKAKFARTSKLKNKVGSVIDKIRRACRSRDEVAFEVAKCALLASTGAIRIGGKEARATPKNWNKPEYRKAPKPAHLARNLRDALSEAAADAGTKEYKKVARRPELAYIKSNFYQSDIDKELNALVKSKTLSRAEANAFGDLLYEEKKQWPRWATELDPNELPEFGSHGITTLRAEHFQEEDGKAFLRFIGKEAKANELEIEDPEILEMLRKAKRNAETVKENAGFLFPWATPGAVLKFNKSVGAQQTRDFRTVAGTTHAENLVRQMPVPKTKKEFDAALKDVGRYVSRRLNNTPAMALKAYIDPTVFSEWRSALGE